MPFRRSYYKPRRSAAKAKRAPRKRVLKRKKKSRNSVVARKMASQGPRIVSNVLRFNPGRPLTILPRKMRDVLTFREQMITESTQSFGAVELLFRGNGCFDPNQTGVGGQPKGFDQYMALYNNFYVVKSKFTVMYTVHSGTSSYYLAIRPFSDAEGEMVDLDFTSLLTAEWAGHTNTKVMCPSVRDTNSNVSTMSATMTTAKALGRGHDRNEVQGSASADPTLQWHWKLARNFSDPAPGGAVNITIDVVISYDVIFSEPVTKSND